MVHPFQEQKGDESCPNLNLESVLGGSDEGFNPQVLLDGLEEDLDPPPLLVDSGDCGRPELEMVCEQHDQALFFRVPHLDSSQKIRTFLLRVKAGEFDNPVGDDV